MTTTHPNMVAATLKNAFHLQAWRQARQQKEHKGMGPRATRGKPGNTFAQSAWVNNWKRTIAAQPQLNASPKTNPDPDPDQRYSKT